MDSKIIETADGSHTLFIENWEETYHSKQGAIEEAYHVFINSGFNLFEKEISILEIGFGTGLNALVTLLEAEKNSCKVEYHTIEAFPIELEKIQKLNYIDELGVKSYEDLYLELHRCEWDKGIEISPYFNFKKRLSRFQQIKDYHKFDLIYYDAFAPKVQPDLWDVPIFQKMHAALKIGGILVTYASNVQAQKSLVTVGFEIEKIPGPKGRREMLRAYKNK